jgi:hypothetical protein
MPDTFTFEAFRTRALAAGFDEVLERHWAPLVEVGTHSHPFDVDAVVTQGRLWLTRQGRTDELTAGDRFTLAHDEPHAERYGDEGATYWVARRNPR